MQKFLTYNLSQYHRAGFLDQLHSAGAGPLQAAAGPHQPPAGLQPGRPGGYQVQVLRREEERLQLMRRGRHQVDHDGDDGDNERNTHR